MINQLLGYWFNLLWRKICYGSCQMCTKISSDYNNRKILYIFLYLAAYNNKNTNNISLVCCNNGQNLQFFELLTQKRSLFLESIESFKYSFLIFEFDISTRVKVLNYVNCWNNFQVSTKVSKRIVPIEVQ